MINHVSRHIKCNQTSIDRTPSSSFFQNELQLDYIHSYSQIKKLEHTSLRECLVHIYVYYQNHIQLHKKTNHIYIYNNFEKAKITQQVNSKQNISRNITHLLVFFMMV